MAKNVFSGDKKDGVSILHNAEDRLKATLIPCVPKGIETYHLTLTTIVWSVLVILFSWLATFNRQWMWGVSGAIVAQYVTDLLDGAIGRHRNTGLVKWGYYMDHFLDYVFLCAMLIGYSLLIPNHMKYTMFFVMAVFCGFMVNSFLQFAATNKFKIAYWGIGPTEMRLVFILINTLIIYLNQSIYVSTVPYVLGIASFGLFFTALNTQRELWAIDMTAKAEEEGDVETQEEDLQGLVLRHFLLSFIIASLAFLVLVMRIGAPFHKIIAGIVYVTSWLPILSALTHRNWIHLKTSPWVRKYVPLTTAAAILIFSAWIAFSVRPSVTSKAYSVSSIRSHIPEDVNAVTNINTQLTDLFSGKRLSTDTTSNNLVQLQMIGSEFLKQQKALTDLIASYEGYYTIERQENPQLHDQAFLVWFAALAIQQNSILSLMELGTSEQIRSAMTVGNTPNTINNNVFDALIRSVVLPNTLVKIGYSTTYLRLIDGQKTSDVSMDNSIRQLSDIAQANITAYYAKLEANSGVILEVLKTTTYAR
jgi:archaetidylinositol phosphate synthase